MAFGKRGLRRNPLGTRRCSSSPCCSAELSACAQIVGIEDTTVTRGDAGSAGSSAGSAGTAAHAGAANAEGRTRGRRTRGRRTPVKAAVVARRLAERRARAPQPAARAAEPQLAEPRPAEPRPAEPRPAEPRRRAAGGASGGATGGGAGQIGNGGGAASECPCSAPKPTCENGKCVVRGPIMAKATTFYIDSTEVTESAIRPIPCGQGQRHLRADQPSARGTRATHPTEASSMTRARSSTSTGATQPHIANGPTNVCAARLAAAPSPRPMPTIRRRRR